MLKRAHAMRKLYHKPLCPYCCKCMIALGEKKLDFTPHLELPWKKRPEFLKLNPAATVPVLVDEQNIIIPTSEAIVEYLDEAYQVASLFGKDIYIRAEIRRLIAWFDIKFCHEVTKKIVFEKISKRQMGLGAPDMKVIRQGVHNLEFHMDYLSSLLSKRRWFGGDFFSAADAAGSGHISCLDYFASINWAQWPIVKEWYARVKSRPSVRPILQTRISTVNPPDYYEDPDF